jgi:hypothetical protein
MSTANDLIELIRPDFDALNTLLLSQLNSDIGFIEEVSQYLIQSGGERGPATHDLAGSARAWV